MNKHPLVTALPLLLAVTSPMATQTTTPHLSTYFGGAGSDEIVVVRQGPGALVTVIGHTSSGGLATAGAYQTTLAGDRDVFVARFDPRLTPGQQLLWCTYLGGADLDLGFDGEVDPATGETTVVGLTLSSPFPGAGTPSGVDGFIARIGASGATLPFSMLVGGTSNDWLCEVEFDPQGLLTVAGVTEAPGSLPAANNSYRGGPTDAFVARIVPVNPPVVAWSTYVGGSNTDGITFSAWRSQNLWWGNLDRMAMTLDPSGGSALCTASFYAATNATTTTCASQGTHAGSADVYLAIHDPAGSLQFGTFFGGSFSEYPKAIAAHPDGGFVIGGVTWSTNLPTRTGCVQSALGGGATSMGGASDGYLCWVDPDPTRCGAPGLRYCTYLGGTIGQDAILSIAIESSGVVTAAGFTAGGNFQGFQATPRCMQLALPPGTFGGLVARIELSTGGPQDVHYLSFVGSDAILNSLTLDTYGDAWLAGATWGSSYPVINAPQPTSAGGREGVLTHLPLLAGGVAREALTCATPACAAPLYTSAGGAPISGSTFELRATNAPPNTMGAVLIGFPLAPCGVRVFNTNWLVVSVIAPTVTTNALGAAEYPLAIPAGIPSPSSWGLGAQWIFLTNPSCPGSGVLGASERLAF